MCMADTTYGTDKRRKRGEVSRWLLGGALRHSYYVKNTENDVGGEIKIIVVQTEIIPLITREKLLTPNT